MPLVRWTWQGVSENGFSERLLEFRPSDGETIRDMMQGRYLLSSKLVETQGASPFAVDVDHPVWLENLHGFAWLRHFREARDEGSRRFACTLVLDWVSRNGQFDRQTWSARTCAQRVMNWLRHYSLITEGASPEQAAAISRSLGSQIQSLRLRVRLSEDPVGRLLAAIALTGAALSRRDGAAEAENHARRLHAMLARQIDSDGLHLSRSAKVQLALLVELVSVRKALSRDHLPLAEAIGEIVDNMHRALDCLTLGTGEPAYFNGCGQLQHNTLVAVQAESTARQRSSALMGGYGLLVAGASRLVADGGLVPPVAHAVDATASALGFEFSHGRELVVASCGPAPSELSESRPLFRQGMAHSAPTINAVSAARLPEKGPLAGLLRPLDPKPAISLDAAEPSLVIATRAYTARFGITLERHITLLAGGRTLVGQDRLIGDKPDGNSAICTLRFHLAPGAKVLTEESDGSVAHIQLGSGNVWTFLWEGAELREEDSVRQSAHFGFHRTRQLVLEAPATAGHEIAWIFTLGEG